MGGKAPGAIGEPNGGTHYVNPYMRKPVDRSLFEKLKLAIWNPEEGKFLGRTPKRWGIIGLIYLIMYICIIIFFMLCMCGLMATIDYTTPRYTLEHSIIGQNPGLGYRPLIVEEDKFMYNFIYYKMGDAPRIQKYVDSIDEFLEPYKNKSVLPNRGLNQMICNGRPPDRNMSCAVDLLGAEMRDCTAENHYGYNVSRPCIFIKLNKIINWQPEYFDDPDDLPADMPDELIQYIRNISDPLQRKQVWMSCFGERPADNETIGELKYYPGRGLPYYYFPYKNTPDYLSPVIAVQFLNLTRNQMVNVRCRGWARNLKFANSLGFSDDRLGSCYVQLMIDDH